MKGGLTASKPVSTPPLALNCTSLYWDKKMSGPMWHFESICLTNGKGLKKVFFLNLDCPMNYGWSIDDVVSFFTLAGSISSDDCVILRQRKLNWNWFSIGGLVQPVTKNSDYFGTKDWPLVFCPSKQYHKTYDHT